MNDNQLARKVKALRKSMGFSQEALAEIAGLSLRTVQRIENENKNPSGDSLKRLSTGTIIARNGLMMQRIGEKARINKKLVFSFGSHSSK